MGYHNPRAAAYLKGIERHQRQKQRAKELLDEDNSNQAKFIIGEVLRCIKPQYIDKRKANKYIL